MCSVSSMLTDDWAQQSCDQSLRSGDDEDDSLHQLWNVASEFLSVDTELHQLQSDADVTQGVNHNDCTGGTVLLYCRVLHPGRDDAAVFQSSEPKCFCGMFWEEEAGNRKSASILRVRAQYQLCTFFFCGFTPGSVQPKQQEPAASCLISAASTPVSVGLI